MIAMLCGKITGNLDEDIKAFELYEDMLAQKEIQAANPIQLIDERLQNPNAFKKLPQVKVSDESWEWMCKLIILIQALPFCDAILLIPGWSQDKLAVNVAWAAQLMKLKILAFDNGVLKRGRFNLNVLENDNRSESSKQADLRSIKITHEPKPPADNYASDNEIGDEDDNLPPRKKPYLIHNSAEQERLDAMGQWLDKEFGVERVKKKEEKKEQKPRF